MNKIVVIVDAYSTGARLAPGFRARGVFSLHVQSMEEVLPICTSSFRPEDFIDNIIFHGDIGRCVNEIKHAIAGNEIICVTTGSEFGVELADQLAMELGFPGNAADTSICRRNKYEMASPNAKTSPHWTSEGDLDFSIYSRRVQYYANEDADRLNKVENSRVSQVNRKKSACCSESIYSVSRLRKMSEKFFKMYFSKKIGSC